MRRIMEEGSTVHKREWILFPMVGNSSPVFLCSLFPGKVETSQLHFEFDETVEVVFSIISPASVHLTSYYLGGCSGQQFHLDDDTYPFVGLLLESYGEDIADTEIEQSANGSDEDEYEGSFINDDVDLGIMSPSTIYSSEVEEVFDKKKCENGKGSHKHLRKKFQFSESEDEDKLPISFLQEKESAVKSVVQDVSNRALGQQKCMRSEVEADKLSLDLLVTKEDQKTTNDKNVEKLKKKRKKCAKEKQNLDADSHSSYEHKAQPNQAEAKNNLEDKVQEEAQVDKTRQDILLAKNENQKQVNDESVLWAVLPWNSNLPPTQMDPESVTKPKRKRKHANKKLLDAIKEYEGKQDDFKTYSCDHELCLQDGYEKGAKPKLNRKGWVDKKILDTDICSHNNSIKEEEGKQDVYKPDRGIKSEGTELYVSTEYLYVEPSDSGDGICDRQRYGEAWWSSAAVWIFAMLRAIKVVDD
ncbi:unnamed protein product [Dovyalis caffra]|uniref:peptidylprolyl isomerase n=1 Tax=Dovyalis caffra TaxID=77055 RepID=A0AAV1RT15_9ROSI|nr:unnamed protein product [Dovyalis caffra]